MRRAELTEAYVYESPNQPERYRLARPRSRLGNRGPFIETATEDYQLGAMGGAAGGFELNRSASRNSSQHLAAPLKAPSW
jgi:hypothetical protein